MSYYGRKYSNTGFLRSINQEVGKRVKTAENYAGTRAQNEHFKRAAGAVWCVLNGFPNRSYFFTRNDINGQLQKFFREKYAIAASGSSGELVANRWHGAFVGFFEFLQKNTPLDKYFLGMECRYFSGMVIDEYVSKVKVLITTTFDGDRFDKEYPNYSDESIIAISFFGVTGSGKLVPQVKYGVSRTVGEFRTTDERIEEEFSFSPVLPHPDYTHPEGCMYTVVGFIPVIDGVQLRSEARFCIFDMEQSGSIDL